MSIYERGTIPNQGQTMEDYELPSQILSNATQKLKEIFAVEGVAPYMIGSWMLRREVLQEEGENENLVVILRGESIQEATQCIIMRGSNNRTFSVSPEQETNRITLEDALYFQKEVELFSRPERLTEEQEKLLDLLYTTPIEAPAQVGRRDAEGKLIRENSTTDRAIAFSDVGFVFVHHDQNPDAPLAPVKVNLRELPPELLEQAGVVFAEMAQKEGIKADFVAGIPNAGTPLALVFSEKTGIAYIDMFEKEETGGVRRIVAADSDMNFKGKSVVIIDDVITEATTKEYAFGVAESLNVENPVLFVLVDRQEGGAETLRKRVRSFYSAFTLDQALRYGLRNGHVTQAQYQAAVNYREQLKSGKNLNP